MIAVILVFLLAANVLFVPFDHWLDTATGFVNFGYWPPGTDVLLVTTLAATAGSGGIGNLVISNWVRDKGFGMGATVGAVPSALGGRKIHLSRVGKIFDVDHESLRRWRLWRRYVLLDQAVLWAGGCFVGMYLT
jgi:hypothetical protein